MASPAKSPYEVLGVPPGASQADVKHAYRELVKKYHPDNYKNHPLESLAKEKMQEINEAYEKLTDPRRNADTGSSYGPTSGPQAGQWPPWGSGSQSGNPNGQSGSQGSGPYTRPGSWQDPRPGNRQDPRYGPYYGGGAGPDLCSSLSCLCCADSCCECGGGDLCGCC